MIKNLPENVDGKIVINIRLKSGECILNKNIPPNLMGRFDKFVSFWNDDNHICYYPLEQVECFDLVLPEEK